MTACHEKTNFTSIVISVTTFCGADTVVEATTANGDKSPSLIMDAVTPTGADASRMWTDRVSCLPALIVFGDMITYCLNSQHGRRKKTFQFTFLFLPGSKSKIFCLDSWKHHLSAVMRITVILTDGRIHN